jgi:hypothetical protein
MSNKAEKITFIVQNMNIFNHFIIIAAVCLFVFQSDSAQKAGATSASEIKADLMIKNINIIDVKTGKVKHSVDVVIGPLCQHTISAVSRLVVAKKREFFLTVFYEFAETAG